MDQGPVRPPPVPPWTRRDLVDLARAVGVVWGTAVLVVATMVAAWTSVSGLPVGEVAPASAIIVAGLLPAFGLLSRFIDASTKGWTDSATIGRRNSFYGDEDVAGLTPVGIFLFVSLPLSLLTIALFV